MTFAAAPSFSVLCPGRLKLVNANTACESGDVNTPHEPLMFFVQPGGARNFTNGASDVIHSAAGAAGCGGGVGVGS